MTEQTITSNIRLISTEVRNLTNDIAFYNALLASAVANGSDIAGTLMLLRKRVGKLENYTRDLIYLTGELELIAEPV